jgi:hypothetical protein
VKRKGSKFKHLKSPQMFKEMKEGKKEKWVELS